jgi:uncharacterized protein YfaT (DUF1175 family)
VHNLEPSRVAFLACTIILFANALTGCHLSGGTPLPLRIIAAPSTLSADGSARSTVRIESAFPCTFELLQGEHRASIVAVHHSESVCEAVIRAGVLPGKVAIRASAPESTHALIEFETTGVSPQEFLPLHEEADREAFRRWFTFLAEVQAFRETSQLPKEIVDCAALLRYSYREALREHDAAWLKTVKLPLAPSLAPVAQYAYPYTPLNANLFETGPGRFAQFADAQTLQTRNSYLVGRDLARALPGDLLFYRQLSASLSFHGMIYLGASQIDQDGKRYVVYHTGEQDGEVRRPSIDELMHYPEAQWRPVPGNSNFLGVYRWNILRKGS